MSDCCTSPAAEPATLADYPARLFEFDNFVTRDHCGNWIPAIERVHFWADLLYATSYFTIPLTILYGWLMWRVSVFPSLLIAAGFGAFIMLCGADHVFSAMSFKLGIYDQQAITKGSGAITSVLVAFLVVSWTSMERDRKRAREIGEIANTELGLSSVPMSEIRETIKAFRETMEESREYLRKGNDANHGDRR